MTDTTDRPHGWQPRALAGDGVELVPLGREHVNDLRAAAADGELWNLFFTVVPRPEVMAAKVDQLLTECDAGLVIPFAVCVDGRAVGTTTLCHLDWPNRRGEIGFTWYAASRQGTGVNLEAKRLLLQLAFDELGFVAVEFRTHWLNHRSRRAIEKLGAKQDGILRSHQIMPDGTRRDTVVYSIVDIEWPAVRSNLEYRARAGRK